MFQNLGFNEFVDTTDRLMSNSLAPSPCSSLCFSEGDNPLTAEPTVQLAEIFALVIAVIVNLWISRLQVRLDFLNFDHLHITIEIELNEIV